MAGILVELELVNNIWPQGVARRLHHVIALASDVGDKSESVGRVGLNRVGTDIRLQPFNGRTYYRATVPYGMDCDVGALVMSGQQKPAFTVGSKISRCSFNRNLPVLREVPGDLVDPVAGYFLTGAMTDV
jgi:hypothetical protein